MFRLDRGEIKLARAREVSDWKGRNSRPEETLPNVEGQLDWITQVEEGVR